MQQRSAERERHNQRSRPNCLPLAAVEPLSKRELKQIGIDEQPEKPIYGWRLTDFRTIKPFPVKGKLNLFNVDDNLIEYIDEEHMTGKELDETFNRYFKPLFD